MIYKRKCSSNKFYITAGKSLKIGNFLKVFYVVFLMNLSYILDADAR